MLESRPDASHSHASRPPSGPSQASPAEAEWPPLDRALLERVVRGDGRPALPGFPLEVLPPAVRDWVADMAATLGVPVDFTAQLLLAAVTGHVGAGAVARLAEGWDEPAILWQALVAAPASDPAPACAVLRRALASVARTPAAQGRTPALVDDEPGPARLLAAAAKSPAGALLWRDLPGAGLGLLADPRARPAPMATLLSGWAPLRSALGPGAPAIGVMVRLETAPLARALGDGDPALLAPLLARLLCTWPAPPPCRPLADRPALRESELVNALVRLAATGGTPTAPLVLTAAPRAAERFDRHLARLGEMLAEAGDGAAAAWLAAGRSTVPRLALAIALADWALRASGSLARPPSVLGEENMAAAVALWEHFRLHSLAVLEHALPADEAPLRRRLLAWLAAHQPDAVSREDVRRAALGQTVDAARAQRVIDSLVAAGLLRPVEDAAAPGRRGRPARRWQVHPALAGNARNAGSPPPAQKRAATEPSPSNVPRASVPGG